MMIILPILAQELRILDTAKAEGKAEGRAEGRDEKAIEIAKKMLKRGTDHGIIAEDTGLSIKDIQALAEEILYI